MFACIVVLWVFVLCNPAISVGLQREEVKGREHKFPCFWFYSSINNQESENVRDPGWDVGPPLWESSLWTYSQSEEAEGFFWRALCRFLTTLRDAVFHESLHTRQPACCLPKYQTTTTNNVVRVMFQLSPVVCVGGTRVSHPSAELQIFYHNWKSQNTFPWREGTEIQKKNSALCLAMPKCSNINMPCLCCWWTESSPTGFFFF